jgi:class 3 adenylate cyclase
MHLLFVCSPYVHCRLLLQDAKQLKALMYALSSQGDMPSAHGGSVSLPQARRLGDVSGQEVAFVHTDIESSTELSQQDGEAFKQVCATCWVSDQGLWPSGIYQCVVMCGSAQ